MTGRPGAGVGPRGFGVYLEHGPLSGWEVAGAVTLPLGRGWTVWCDPDLRDAVEDGTPVVVADPARGLEVGVYRTTAAGPVLETDPSGAAAPERRPIAEAWVRGPIVYATTGGVLRRRRR